MGRALFIVVLLAFTAATLCVEIGFGVLPAAIIGTASGAVVLWRGPYRVSGRQP